MSTVYALPDDYLLPRRPCAGETGPHTSRSDGHRIPASGFPRKIAIDGRCWPAEQPAGQQFDTPVVTSRTYSDPPFRDSCSTTLLKAVKRVSLVETVTMGKICTMLLFEMRLDTRETPAATDGNIIRFHEDTLCSSEEAVRFYVDFKFSVELGNDKISALGKCPSPEEWNTAISSQYDAFMRLRGGNLVGPNLSHYSAQNNLSKVSWSPNCGPDIDLSQGDSVGCLFDFEDTVWPEPAAQQSQTSDLDTEGKFNGMLPVPCA
ncbi:hypothetical protein BKA63DRAFT_497402 [Paraphoma chrysanthemicola]|nr:hypothetical protein BKA63DRAFT_497402 [Paraphoma chrysanthemicola]